MSSLYFESDSPETIRHDQVGRIRNSNLAEPIPLYVRFHVRGHPIVGTTLDYFEFRRLRLATGRNMTVLGECVIGSSVAKTLKAQPGASIVSSPENVFDLAGVYPLKMHVVGVLEPSHTPDDRAIFVDVKSAWIIAGLGHGHQDLSASESASGVLSRKGTKIIANASVVQYNEIDAANLEAFHFHGDLDSYPLTAIIAVPHDAKSGVILRGRYQSSEESCQILEPIAVMDDLLETVLTVQSYVVAAVLLVSLSTLATAALVFLLSLRLRRQEIQTMVKIGGSRLCIRSLIGYEVLVVILVSIALAGLLTALTTRFGSAAIRSMLLS